MRLKASPALKGLIVPLSTLITLKYFCINHGDQRVLFLLEIFINFLALSTSYEYLCYESTVIIFLILSVQRPTLDVRI